MTACLGRPKHLKPTQALLDVWQAWESCWQWHTHWVVVKSVPCVDARFVKSSHKLCWWHDNIVNLAGLNTFKSWIHCIYIHMSGIEPNLSFYPLIGLGLLINTEKFNVQDHVTWWNTNIYCSSYIYDWWLTPQSYIYPMQNSLAIIKCGQLSRIFLEWWMHGKKVMCSIVHNKPLRLLSLLLRIRNPGKAI